MHPSRRLTAPSGETRKHPEDEKRGHSATTTPSSASQIEFSSLSPSLTILFIDDRKEIAGALASALAEQDTDSVILRAHDLAEAKLRLQNNEIDILLLDPRRVAPYQEAAIRSARSFLGEDLPLIALESDPAKTASYTEAGAEGTIPPEATPQELLQALTDFHRNAKRRRSQLQSTAPPAESARSLPQPAPQNPTQPSPLSAIEGQRLIELCTRFVSEFEDRNALRDEMMRFARGFVREGRRPLELLQQLLGKHSNPDFDPSPRGAELNRFALEMISYIAEGYYQTHREDSEEGTLE